jgi:putative transcriptional regulator
MQKKYKSEALAALHESMIGLHDIGIIRAKTMREFDESCLTAVKAMPPEKIIEVRTKSGVSQAVFAKYLTVTTGTVSKWESGKKHPSGPALKLLDLVKRKGLEAIA